MKIVGYFFVTSLLASSSFAQLGKDSGPVVAIVNGNKIFQSTYVQEYRQARMFVSHKVVTKENVIDNLINRELGIEKAKNSRIDQDPEVRRKLEDVMYHAQISKDLAPEFQKISVADKDVEKYYKENPEYKTAHILFRLEAIPQKTQVEAAIEQSLKVYKQVKGSPDSFADLANKFSQANISQNGGVLGFQPSASLAPEYFQAIKGKSPGFISTPVRSQYGIHIIKLLAVKPFDQIDMPLYKKTVYDIKRDAIIASYNQNLRKNANVQINKEFL